MWYDKEVKLMKKEDLGCRRLARPGKRACWSCGRMVSRKRRICPCCGRLLWRNFREEEWRDAMEREAEQKEQSCMTEDMRLMFENMPEEAV